jgi:hypothetical protein
MSNPKGGPLSKAEKFYITNNTELSTKDLSKDLNRSSEIVKKYRESLPDQEDESTLKVSDLMARTDRGATTMTESASMLSDEGKSERAKDSKPPVERSFKGSIHRIK